MNTFPLVTASGSHFDVGVQVGTSLSGAITDKLLKNRLLCGDKLDEKIHATRPYLDLVKKHFPQYLLELEGMSKGAGVPFDELFLANVQEVIDDNPYEAMRCTVIGIPQDGGWFVGFNEDWMQESLPHLYVFDVTIEGNRFFGLGYAYELISTSIAINSHGLLQAINELPAPDVRIGVPKNFIARAVLDCTTLDGARHVVQSVPRGGAFNHALFQGEDLLDIEYTPDVLGTERITKEKYVHTNSYIVLPKAPVLNSISEQRRQKIQSKIATIQTVEDLKIILSDTEDPPVCRPETIGSVIFDTAKRVAYVAYGQPTPTNYSVIK